MPGWHEATGELQKAGKVRMVGIVQEQHPERARLFMQWKEIDWPILVDSLNLLGVAVVPITVAIDEHGIVRVSGLGVGTASKIGESFVGKTFEAPGGGLAQPMPPADIAALEAAADPGSPDAMRDYADALVLQGGNGRLDEAIDAYRRALAVRPDDGEALFRLGVAFRMRYDDRGLGGDFQSAVASWSAALQTNPNQYIWRRRIQQYGPRLMKPYPFYDWVAEAREAIEARGEKPVELPVEPGGAEIARPARSFNTESAGDEPDADGRITRDERGLVDVDVTVVPGSVQPGGAVRLHLAFRPSRTTEAHWNNEVEDLAVWISPPPGWEVDRALHTTPNPSATVSRETRRIEVELKSDTGVASGPVEVRGYALYYVCEDVKGTCLYRRQDFRLPVEVR